MEKTRFCEYSKFPPEILREGRLALTSDVSKKPYSTMFEVYVGRDVWEFDAEDEFFAEYRENFLSCACRCSRSSERLEGGL